MRIAAACFLVQLIFILTGPPAALMDWLTGQNMNPPSNPRYIVILGGGGIPSGNTLLRLWHAAQFGAGLTGTTFIVALPADNAPENSSVGRMRDELVLRGIPAASIQLETRGLDTHEQAVNVAQMIQRDAPVVVVTSGFHVRRAVLCFRKAGCTNVTGLYAYGTGAEADLGAHQWWRYSIWGNWGREVEICRELTALLAYKLRGWI
jgi:uncharacterized SAM-binding protein YcdF (DUF218 family)